MLPKRISPFAQILNRCLIITTIGIFIAAPSFTQQKKVSAWTEDLIQSYSCAYAQQERLFVFLNSGFYYPGENLSFKAVLFGADMNIKTDGSRFFYLQLISNTGNSICNYTFELHSGEYSGKIMLPDTLLTGLYTLKAYTRWMQHYGPGNSYQRPLVIISPLQGTTLHSTEWDSIPVHFYPACGKFISDAENTLLVRVNPFQLFPVKQLSIVDDLGKNILSCIIDTNGMGVFTLIPVPGRTYFAVAADSGQPRQSFQLPDQQYSGYSMNIKTDRDLLNIAIVSAPETQHEEVLYLAVLTGNAGKSIIRQLNPENNRDSMSVPLPDLPAGLSQLLLLSKDSVLCSRVWYRKSDPCVGIETEIKDTLKTRESAIASYHIPPAASHGKTLLISVNEYNPITDNRLYSDISHFQYFDLYSSLSNPEIMPVFESTASEGYINDWLIAFTRSLPMNFVFLSQDNGSYIRETQGIMLTGRIISPVSQLPIAKSTVLLSYPDSVAQINYSFTNERGEFSFTLNDRLYNKEVYLMVMDFPHDGNTVKIITDDPFAITPSNTSAIPLYSPSFEPVINDHQNIAMAYRVFYSAKTQSSQPVIQKSPSGTKNFYGKPDFTLIPAEYESLPDIFEIRKNLIPGLKLKVENDYCTMTVFDDYLQLFYTQQALVLLNNIPYPSFKSVLELNSDVIRSIDIMRSKFFYDHFLMYGIVAINTIKPMVIEPYYSYHITTIRVVSDTIETAPMQMINEGTLPDVRHSLYWGTGRTPLTDTAGIRFSTSDIKGRYQLKVFYITADGSLHCADKVFTVL
jgi:hypothetical protein